MNNNIAMWKYKENKLEFLNRTKAVFDAETSVTSIRFQIDTKRNSLFLLASYTSGDIEIFKEDEKENFVQIFSGLAHHPDSPSEDFGSLGDYAEIWSTAWNCYGDIKKFATVSEDQTCRVWEFDESTNKITEVRIVVNSAIIGCKNEGSQISGHMRRLEKSEGF